MWQICFLRNKYLALELFPLLACILYIFCLDFCWFVSLDIFYMLVTFSISWSVPRPTCGIWKLLTYILETWNSLPHHISFYLFPVMRTSSFCSWPSSCQMWDGRTLQAQGQAFRISKLLQKKCSFFLQHIIKDLLLLLRWIKRDRHGHTLGSSWSLKYFPLVKRFILEYLKKQQKNKFVFT